MMFGEIIFDLECWVDVEFKIYNRWGSLVFEGYGEDYSSYPYWDGSMQGGSSYVVDGMYVYTFYARKHNSPEIYQKSGHLTGIKVKIVWIASIYTIYYDYTITL